MTAPRRTPEDSASDDAYAPLSPLRTGLTCRCPRCGKGRLFAGFLTVAARCAVCGFDLSEQNSGDGPAVFIIFILGAVVVPLVFWFEFAYEPPIWLHMLIWVPVILGGALGMLRPMKGVMIALQYRNKASDSGTVDYSLTADDRKNGSKDDREDER
ncbi:DUF983 domain-containing protein [Pelagibius litoralis]|uniref:DUF983 domain-containing protein n=1 Tax=Pelagibius litoralis TaxID=374515 RepID=A0A967F2W3_9PROT|nr:DUF983 domain-containing protein [Pelagibius litoralis]NIA72198.1 DUF983 domain-containing protein [Pelagibius litoralis]